MTSVFLFGFANYSSLLKMLMLCAGILFFSSLRRHAYLIANMTKYIMCEEEWVQQQEKKEKLGCFMFFPFSFIFPKKQKTIFYSCSCMPEHCLVCMARDGSLVLWLNLNMSWAILHNWDQTSRIGKYFLHWKVFDADTVRN